MNYINYIILTLCLFFISCNKQKIQDANITSVSIDLEKCKDLKLENFVEKMEIIPLETDSFCLLDQYDQIIYSEDMALINNKLYHYLIKKGNSLPTLVDVEEKGLKNTRF